jgi:hypothetical protein
MRLREQTVDALKQSPLLRYGSRRLVADLVERFGVQTVRRTGPNALVIGDLAILVVIEGQVIVGEAGGALPSVDLGPGVYLGDDARFVRPGRDAKVFIEPRDAETAEIYVVEKRELGRVLEASPTLERSFDAQLLDRILGGPGEPEPDAPLRRGPLAPTAPQAPGAARTSAGSSPFAGAPLPGRAGPRVGGEETEET